MHERLSATSILVEAKTRETPGLQVTINDTHGLMDRDSSLVSAVSEMIRNSGEAGAKHVRVEITQGRLSIIDDAVHTKAKQEEAFEIINGILNAETDAEMSRAISLRASREKRRWGGVGLWSSRGIARQRGGDLRCYKGRGGTIKMVMTWKHLIED